MNSEQTQKESIRTDGAEAGKNHIITWLYAEKEGEESSYPQVGMLSSSPAFLAVYWKCVYVFFRTALESQPKETRYLFFTNLTELPTDLNGVDFNAFFQESGIKVIHRELSKKTPVNWYGSWRNQLYVFDILDAIKDSDGNFMILDSDIVFRKDVTPVFEEISRNGVLEYIMEYDSYNDDKLINGITTKQMREIYAGIYNEYPDDLLYGGGEFIGLTGEFVNRILGEFPFLWEKNYRLFEEGKPKLNEEAHLLSVLYYRCGRQNNLARSCIKRMWSTVRYDTLSHEDLELPIWHLPAEKKYALAGMFNRLRNGKTVSASMAFLERALGIRLPYPLRILRRAVCRVFAKLLKK